LTTFVYRSLGASFSSPRSWAFPFRAFLPAMDQEGVSSPSSALALPSQTFQPDSGASAIYSPPLSRPPPLLPNCLRRGGGCCSLGLYQPLGSSLRIAPMGVSLAHLSFSSFERYDLSIVQLRDPKAPLDSAWLSPSVKGANPSGLLRRRSPATFSSREPAADYFFLSRT